MLPPGFLKLQSTISLERLKIDRWFLHVFYSVFNALSNEHIGFGKLRNKNFDDRDWQPSWKNANKKIATAYF